MLTCPTDPDSRMSRLLGPPPPFIHFPQFPFLTEVSVDLRLGLSSRLAGFLS